MNHTIEFIPNEILSVERESNPGVFYRCLVIYTDSKGRIKLGVQDKYEAGLSKKHLKEYMYDNGITQAVMADILKVSRTTMHRYLKGDRRIPTRYFKMLGIELVGSELQTQTHLDKLHEIAATVHALAKKLDKIIKLEREETL